MLLGPKRIDADTTLERASASGRTLTYHYKLRAVGSPRDQVESFLVRNVTPKGCTGELRPGMKQSGVSYAYSYTSDDFEGPVVVTVSEQVCKNLEP